ncbi:hypothetical protein P7228_03095 [Altererythrobacter arenosus]|uniref:DUF4340 domain-containing protein n=1 Tax=Altererythrobacter arenosus TaxID=3032592 RepID=A0ABY8FSS6_9SPHN|nr:hypothetical protein [Altererythrobacter sp. CAU 1644]WFL78071.1 hypothetical protein P7228_03095 [Altererythrobacter sp. CAU 1644]
MKFRIALIAAVLAAGMVAAPAQAGWRLVKKDEPREVARSNVIVTPTEDWNRSTQRPTKRAELWTREGMQLTDLGFYMGIKDGEALFKRRQEKRNPMPEFDSDMLPTDIVEWYEDTANVVLGGSLFEITEVRPAKFAGYDGVHFAFSYTGGDNVERLGEVRAAIIDERLYLISFDAPKLYYFDRYISGVRVLMDSAQIKR